MAKITEDCFFFSNQNEEYLYGCIYIPKSNISETGIVIVPPVGHERIRCYRECVTLARELAEAGYSVLRFDYRGEGESFGAFEDFDVTSRLEDIKSAINEIKKRADIKHICLLGFRLGALFSLMVASRQDIFKTILCEPILDTKMYVKKLIRAHIIMQREYFGVTNINSDNIKMKLRQGKPMNVYGFYLSYGYIDQLEKINTSAYINLFKGISAIICFTRKQALNEIPVELKKWYQRLNLAGKCDYYYMTTKWFTWSTKKIWTDKIGNLSEKVIKCLNNDNRQNQA